MKVFSITLFLLASFIIGCDKASKSNPGSNRATDSGINLKYQSPLIDTNKLFLENNYLKIDRILSGPIYWDENSSKNIFFRILEIYEEEHILLYIEKISVGEEGGNYQLVKRYSLDEKKLSLQKFELNSVDSIDFIDNITIIGLFDKIKYKIDLDKIKVSKE